MNDAFITAINTQYATVSWIDALAENMTNVYTPGFRERKINFKTFLNGAVNDNVIMNQDQGKSTPGTSPENVYLEGKGYFLTRTPDGKSVYTRLGEFTFDSDGIYRDTNGNMVQGYILNDKGEIMQGTKSITADLYQQTALKGGALDIPTTNIKLWIDPNNGKFLGKYDEYEIKNDGTIVGKAENGKKVVPLYKITIRNFHNPSGLYEIKDGKYIETEESGKPLLGVGEIRSGLLELSNSDLKVNISYYTMAKVQMDIVNQLIKSNKDLLQQAMQMASGQ